MRVGFIFECGPNGADVQVCRNLVARLRPEIEFVPRTLDNKPNLVRECGPVAGVLLARLSRFSQAKFFLKL